MAQRHKRQLFEIIMLEDNFGKIGDTDLRDFLRASGSILVQILH